MTIPFFDYRPALARQRAEVDAAIQRVLDSGRLILGPEVAAFESEFATFVGSPHAVGVNSGTDALILALRALELEPQAEVITVSNAGPPPVAAIRAAGAQPRFVDIEPSTLLLDPAQLERALTPKSACIVVVHLYGQPVALDPVLAFAKHHGLRVIEDCAQAHGARYRGRMVGGFGDIGCFSFYPTKNLGALGDGGVAVTADEDLARRMRRLRMYGFDGDRESQVEGFNTRLDELQAAILRVKLRQLPDENRERQQLAARYLEALEDQRYGLPIPRPEVEHVYHLFVLQAVQRQKTIAALEAAGIGFGIHYDAAVHRMRGYAFLGLAEGSLPHSERACAEVLSLPLYPGLEPAAVDQVIDVLRAAERQ